MKFDSVDHANMQMWPRPSKYTRHRLLRLTRLGVLFHDLVRKVCVGEHFLDIV